MAQNQYFGLESHFSIIRHHLRVRKHDFIGGRVGWAHPGPTWPEFWAQMGLICYFKGSTTYGVSKCSALHPEADYVDKNTFNWDQIRPRPGWARILGLEGADLLF